MFKKFRLTGSKVLVPELQPLGILCNACDAQCFVDSLALSLLAAIGRSHMCTPYFRSSFEDGVHHSID